MHSDPVRPSTPSFRIVTTPAVNPSPTFSDAFEEEEVLFEDVLSPKKLGVSGVTGDRIPVIPSGQEIQDELDGYLCADTPLVHMRQLSGYSDLSKVISLDLVVDTSESSLGSLGNYLPNIRELRLSGSRISSVRDLGTTLRSLQVLWMSRCGLQDLDGIGSIGKLRELYLSYNEISDVSPLSMVDSLELVDIESNNVGTLDQVEFLCMCPSLSTLNIEGNPVTSLLPPAELRKKISVLLPGLKFLDDQPLGGMMSGQLTTSSHPLLGNTGSLQSEILVVNTSLKDTMSEAQRRPKSAKLERDELELSTPSPTPSPGLPPDHSSGLTQGAVICGPPSKLRTKLSKNVKENIYSDILEKSAPPTPVGAWSEDPDEMLQEWKTSRDWLSRELTIDSVNEERSKSEKRANYEAALRESSRPNSSSHKLSRPTSAARKSPAGVSHPSSPKSRKSTTPTFYDESVEVEEKPDRRALPEARVTGSHPTRQRSNSDRRRSGSRDRRSSSRDRSKGKEKLSKKTSVSSSSEFPKRRKSVERSKGSVSLDPDLLSNPIKAIYRPTIEDSRPEIRALPTPPAVSRGMSSRFRRLKVSIEDQVSQQTSVDVLYNDKMPRPGLSRHTVTVPKAPDCS